MQWVSCVSSLLRVRVCWFSGRMRRCAASQVFFCVDRLFLLISAGFRLFLLFFCGGQHECHFSLWTDIVSFSSSHSSFVRFFFFIFFDLLFFVYWPCVIFDGVRLAFFPCLSFSLSKSPRLLSPKQVILV